MSCHVYPTAAMLGDYLRAAVGFVPSVVGLAALPLGLGAEIVLGGFAAIFAAFGVRTAVRHATRIEMTDAALRASGMLRTSISWGELDRMKLAYYSTRRDRQGGWMQLELRAGRSVLRVDSRIEGFTDLARVAARAAEMRSLPLSASTLVNLQALGVKTRIAEPGLGEAAGGAA